MAANPRGAAAFDRESPEFAGLWVNLEREITRFIAGYLKVSGETF
jgi:hypothetical protein